MDVDLQPHRSRYWKTPTPDDAFQRKAAQIIWCYERAQALAEQGEVVLCLDEKPNIQVLERRCPTYRVRPGLIEKPRDGVRDGVKGLVPIFRLLRVV